MASPVFKALQAGASSLRSYVGRGFWHTLGAEPLELMKDGASWNWFGRGIMTQQGRVGPRFTGERKPGSPLWQGVWTVAQMGGTAMAVAEGYASGGVLGAASGFGWDLAVNAAMVKHGYKFAKNKGNLRVIGLRGGALGMFGRYALGSTFAMAAGHMVGGGLPGFGASLAGGYLGVRHGGKMLLGYAGYQAVKFTGKATMATLKAGYEHRQMQKNIHTSGSLAAFHTQGAHTMRQRAVQAIHKSHLNARSALGSEAQFMHYPSKNYHSRYRVAG